MRDSSSWMWYADIVILTVLVVVFIVDWKRHCADKEVWIWVIGFLAIVSLDFCGQFFIIRWSDYALYSLKCAREEVEKANAVKTGNGLFDTFAFLRRGSGGYFNAYFRYKGICDSWLYFALNW